MTGYFLLVSLGEIWGKPYVGGEKKEDCPCFFKRNIPQCIRLKSEEKFVNKMPTNITWWKNSKDPALGSRHGP
jgi:hypothetical protein